MANVFLDSAATGAADGTTWADAYTTVAAAIAGMSSGDTLAWANTSSESSASSITLSFPDDSHVISSTVSGGGTITFSKALNAQITTTSSSSDITINTGFSESCRLSGVWFSSGKNIVLEDTETNECAFDTCTASNSGRLSVLGSCQSNYDTVKCSFAAAMFQPVIFINNQARLEKLGGTIESLSAPLQSFHSAIKLVLTTSSAVLEGVDCSNFPQENFLDWAALNVGSFVATKCRLNALTTNLVLSTAIEHGSSIIIDAVDSSNTVNRQYRNARNGQLFSDTGIVLDATNPSSAAVSNKIVTNTNAMEFFAPVRFPIIQGWADFSTAKTIDIEFCQDGTTTPLTDAEIWVEVQYPDDTTSLYHVDTDRAADNQTTANQTTSTAAWTGLSGTNVKQKCSVTTTQTGKAGPYQAFICVAKSSTTVYVNPKADIS